MVSVTNNLGAGIYGTPKTSSASTRGLGAGIFGAPKVTGTRAPAGDTPAGTPPPTRRGSQNIEAPAPSQTRRPKINWQTSDYNSQIAAIQRALQDFETGAQTRGERYGQDFSTGLGRLGYRPAEGFQAMPNILEAMAAGTFGQKQELVDSSGGPGDVSVMNKMLAGEKDPTMPVSPTTLGGAFDIEGQFDPYSTAARGTRGVRDEFAGRGTLRSSDFARSFGEFQNRLNQQLEAMETARGRFGQDLASEVAQRRVQAQEQQQAAQRDAMMRAAIASAQAGGF
jgi:hypothetical protein